MVLMVIIWVRGMVAFVGDIKAALKKEDADLPEPPPPPPPAPPAAARAAARAA